MKYVEFTKKKQVSKEFEPLRPLHVFSRILNHEATKKSLSSPCVAIEVLLFLESEKVWQAFQEENLNLKFHFVFV